MDYTCRTRSLQSLTKDIEKGKIALTHKLQRPEGQWNRKQKTDLLDSLLRHYPINPTYAIKDENGMAIIDGVQRLSTVRDYINNKFAFSKDMESVVINGEEKNLAGLKFKKLDEDTKDEILKSELQIYELTDCSEKDVREMFRRQNSGRPLSNKLMRVVYGSDKFNDEVCSLVAHPFMEKLMSKTQRKNGTDKDVIIQTLMLIQTNQENDFTSFRPNDMNSFVSDHGDESLEKVSTLTEAMNRLNDSFDTIKLQVTSMPQVLYAAYRVTKDKKSFSKLAEVIADFIANYDSNEEYKQFVQSGTGNQENVRGRFDWWRNKLKSI